MKILLAVAVLLPLLVSSSLATPRIYEDYGGDVGQYAHAAARIGHVEIDGECFSSCALFLRHACVTPNAIIGFHSARRYSDNGMDANLNRRMMAAYPSKVRNWVRANGGLQAKMIYLSGSALAAVMPPCHQ